MSALQQIDPLCYCCVSSVSAQKDLTHQHVVPDIPATSAAPASPPAKTQKNKTKKASWWRMKSEDGLEEDSAGPKPPVSAVPDKEAVTRETFLPPSATDLRYEVLLLCSCLKLIYCFVFLLQ